MTVIDHPSPNQSARKAGVRVDTVLIHHTATRANAVGNAIALATLRDPRPDHPESAVSAHYVLTTVGAVYRLVPEARKAWHAGKGRLPWETCAEYDFNHRSIGIEVVNPGDGKTPFTEAQYTALAWLVPDIVRRLGWRYVDCSAPWSPNDPRTRRHMQRQGDGYILGHRDVAPGRKTDPADSFDWARIRAALAGGAT